MSKKSAAAPETPLQILPDLIHKYLIYLYFIKSYSAQTVRAYRVDLMQAFALNPQRFPSFDELLTENVQIKAANHTPPSPSDLPSPEKLLDLGRQAQQRWASLSPATRNRKAACLKSLFNWLHEEGWIERDLGLHIHAPKVPVRLPHHLSVDEALALLRSVQMALNTATEESDRKLALRDFALIMLLYGGGLRVSEACSLRWSQIDLDQKLLRIQGKGGKERIVALPAISVAALKKLLRSSEPFVFGPTPLSTRLAYEIVRSRGASAGLIKPLHPHALRHSYATHLLSSGANLRTLQELLGHRTLQATQRYTHIGIDQLARTLEKCHPLGHAHPKPKRS